MLLSCFLKDLGSSSTFLPKEEVGIKPGIWFGICGKVDGIDNWKIRNQRVMDYDREHFISGFFQHNATPQEL